MLTDLPDSPEFRIARPVPTRGGSSVAHGWEASQWVAGAPDVSRLTRARRPVALDSQVVHGDLPGNVLFADGLPPAIIDWPAYWRPTSWASAVAVADALCWYGAAPRLAARWAELSEWGQMLVRALIYRIATDDAALGPAAWTPEHLAAYRPVVDLAVGYVARKWDD